jgi:hypothetical protein
MGRVSRQKISGDKIDSKTLEINWIKLAYFDNFTQRENIIPSSQTHM